MRGRHDVKTPVRRVSAPLPAARGLTCHRCGSRARTGVDRYRLVLPVSFGLEQILRWGGHGHTLAELVRAGVQIEKTCAKCSAEQEREHAQL